MDAYENVVKEIRRFNRFYTVNMGFLDSDYLDSDYSMAETRVLFELKMHGTCIQSDIVKILHIDKSYLSRLIQRFCKRGLMEKVKSEGDRRATKITLTPKGLEETERLIALIDAQIESQVKGFSLEECEKLCSSIRTMISILGKGDGFYESDSI